jgi:hypothetical protein
MRRVLVILEHRKYALNEAVSFIVVSIVYLSKLEG